MVNRSTDIAWCYYYWIIAKNSSSSVNIVQLCRKQVIVGGSDEFVGKLSKTKCETSHLDTRKHLHDTHTSAEVSHFTFRYIRIKPYQTLFTLQNPINLIYKVVIYQKMQIFPHKSHRLPTIFTTKIKNCRIMRKAVKSIHTLIPKVALIYEYHINCCIKRYCRPINNRSS